MTKKTNLIAPELVQRMARLPFLWHYFNEKDGHILVTQTPAGIADRVVVFGHGLRALEQLQAAVTLIEGTLAYLGYEDPASARIDINRWVSVRWLRTELNDAGTDIEAFRQFVSERGNEFIDEARGSSMVAPDDSTIRYVMTRNLDTKRKCGMYICSLTFDDCNPHHVAYDENYRGSGIAYWDVPADAGEGYMLDEVTEIIPFDR